MNKPVLPMSSLSLKLPTADRQAENYRLAASRTFPTKLQSPLNRVAFSAAHVVADPLADNDPWLTAAVDWDRTIAFREHVWDLGLGVAEAMDTAQRGMGLDWNTSLELIQRSVRAAKPRGALVFSGAGTDHLAVEDAKTIDDVIRAYEEQLAAVEKAGGRIILMASRALAKIGRSADDYAKVYNRVLWPGEGAGHHPLARRHVRSGAIRLLGHRRSRQGDGHGGRHHQRQCGQDRRRESLAARQAARDRHAPPPRQEREDVYRRRLQLRRTDRRRRARAFPTRCSASSMRLRRRRPTRCRGWRPATRPASTTCSARPCRCRAISSARPRASTRPVSCSWPGSTATRITSPWSAGRRARARPCISPSCFVWPTRPGCSAILNSRPGA